MNSINRFAVVVVGVVGASGVAANDYIPQPYVGAQYGHTNFNRGALIDASEEERVRHLRHTVAF